MLINAITFEIRNFADGSFEEFIVEDTPTNFDLISHHRFTREIKFTKLFEFEFVNKRRVPKFIELGLAVANHFRSNNEIEEIDDVDEMVGTF